MNNNTNKSKEIFLYGILGIPIASLGFPLYIYLPTFYVEYIGLSVGMVGFVLLIARLMDMILDPFIGRITDKYNNFNIIFISTFFVLLGLFFLIKPIYFTAIWLFCFSLITYISYSFVMIPYLTLNSKLSNNSFDNTRLAFSREIFIIIGVLLALLFPYIFSISQDSKKSLELSLNTILIIFPIITLIFYLKLKHLEKKEIMGRAYATDKTNSKLKVSFFRPFYGDYWVLILDENYEYVLVGTPNREYLWILARQNTISEEVKNSILEKLPSLGFDASKFLWTIQE